MDMTENKDTHNGSLLTGSWYIMSNVSLFIIQCTSLWMSHYLPFCRKCDYPQRSEPKGLPNPLSSTRDCAAGTPVHPPVPEECSGSPASQRKEEPSRWVKGTLPLNNTSSMHVHPSHLLFLSKAGQRAHKNSSLPWYRFSSVTPVPLETARAAQPTPHHHHHHHAPPPFSLFQLCNIFSPMEMIDNLLALIRSSLSLSPVWR